MKHGDNGHFGGGHFGEGRRHEHGFCREMGRGGRHFGEMQSGEIFAGENFGGGGGHRRHGGGHRGGPGRPGRFFEHGDLRLVALHLIAEKPRHGYEIIKAIEEQSGGAYTPSAGAVYPTLTLLLEIGHLTMSDGADGRKLHAITEEGAAALLANRKTVDAILARIARAGASRGPSPVLEDAIGRFRHTLRLRLAHGPLDETQMKLIAAKLDEVSAVIEQGMDSPSGEGGAPQA